MATKNTILDKVSSETPISSSEDSILCSSEDDIPLPATLPKNFSFGNEVFTDITNSQKTTAMDFQAKMKEFNPKNNHSKIETNFEPKKSVYQESLHNVKIPYTKENKVVNKE